jgi:hemoglobin-like flavoprotein
MTPQQIHCIQRSFQTITAIRRPFSQIFYIRLFQLSPELKSQLNCSSDQQGRKLFAILGTAVRSLHNLDGLDVVVTSLGRRYSNQGFRPQHYADISRALLETLEKALGDEFSGEISAAWTALSVRLIETLQDSTSQNPLAHCAWGKEIPMALAVQQ